MDFKALLAEEKTLGKNAAAAYRVDAFEKIDRQLDSIKDEEKLMELREEAKKASEENKDSLILVYVAERILISLRPHEYSMRLNNLLLTFYEAGNWDVVKYIGALILSHSESSKALRVLADVAEHQGDEERKWEYYERFVKADGSDKEIIVALADHYEEKGDRKAAMNYYQRALRRLQKTDDAARIKEIFTRLVENGRSGYPFYSSFTEAVAEKDPETGLELYRILLSYLVSSLSSFDPKSSEYRSCLDSTIEISRRILRIDGSDEETKKKAEDALRLKYASSSRLDECLRKHRIARSQNSAKALDEFEKDIAYSSGTYVLQKATRRVGLIIDVKGGIVSVRYSANDVQTIALDSAFNALTPLSKQNIKAIKKGVPAPKIKAKIMGEGGIEWLVRTLLYSAADSKATMKDMKGEVVPSILQESEWKAISDKVKAELRDNSYVRIIPGSTDIYQLTAYPSTKEEKVSYIFRNEPTFYGKVSTILDAVSGSIEKDSDAFMEMISYFQDTLANDKKEVSERIASVLLLDYLSEKGAPVSFEISFDMLYSQLYENERKEVFAQIENTVLKREFVDQVISLDKKKAPDTLVQIFPYYINSYIPNKLRRLNKGVEYYALIRRSIESFRDNIPLFIFFATEANISPEDLKKAGIDEERIFRSELMALSHITKAPDNPDNRKNIKTLRKDLVEGRKIASFLTSAPREAIEDSLSLILFNEGLESDEKSGYREMIRNRFPDISFSDERKPVERPHEIKVASGFLCTQESYDRKKDELKDINTVQMPEILKEINFARELGDLRENSEYQYAKDHKRELERRIGELNNDLTTVRIMTMADVLPGLIGFGTKVTLHDNAEGKDITYTFMGRWESDPENGIIDFNAPLGQKLVNHKEGDVVKFEINGRDYDLTVLKIEPVQF